MEPGDHSVFKGGERSAAAMDTGTELAMLLSYAHNRSRVRKRSGASVRDPVDRIRRAGG
jgi:hypothetical protein